MVSTALQKEIKARTEALGKEEMRHITYSLVDLK